VGDKSSGTELLRVWVNIELLFEAGIKGESII
jgi:hypothetical protein